MKPIKKLGQNFLINKKAIFKIIEGLEINTKDKIVEIGAGTGNLTKEILKKTNNLIVIEKDKRMIEILRNLSTDKNFQVIEEDVRKILPEISKKINNYKIIGNIPYYLTGWLFRMIQELKNPPQLVIFVIQREVAERIIGRKKNNQLSSIIRLWANPKILFHLKPSDFKPIPKIKSSVLKLEIIKKREKNEEGIIDLIKIGFKHSRKTLLNNLIKEFNKERITKFFKEKQINQKIRAEEFSLKDWKELYGFLG
jgi:16S rRNA (adenine1518-N6/adenine1519-N6)-dimethyltransferase